MMVVVVDGLRGAELKRDRESGDVNLTLFEADGNLYGTKVSEIKISARSYKMLRDAVVEDWLEEKRS
jgi:hypothetical protein